MFGLLRLSEANGSHGTQNFSASFHQLLMETKCEKAMGTSIIPLENKLLGGLFLRDFASVQRSISLSHQLFQISEKSHIYI